MTKTVNSNSLELGVIHYRPHRFKRTEWTCTKRELVEAITLFYQEVLVPSACAPFVNTDWVIEWWPPWQPDNIGHFLSCFFHLVRGPVMTHHHRCVATLIRHGVIRRSVHRLGAV